MSYRIKLLTLFALFGFVIGVAAYGIINWLMLNNLLILNLTLLQSPWLISGVAGAVLSLLILVVFARFSKR